MIINFILVQTFYFTVYIGISLDHKYFIIFYQILISDIKYHIVYIRFKYVIMK